MRFNVSYTVTQLECLYIICVSFFFLYGLTHAPCCFHQPVTVSMWIILIFFCYVFVVTFFSCTFVLYPFRSWRAYLLKIWFVCLHNFELFAVQSVKKQSLEQCLIISVSSEATSYSSCKATIRLKRPNSSEWSWYLGKKWFWKSVSIR